MLLIYVFNGTVAFYDPSRNDIQLEFLRYINFKGINVMVLVFN